MLDRKTLRTLGITLAGGITTLITALLTLADTEAGAEYQDESAANCALSAVQREVIKSVLGNSSCAQNGFAGFNRSLASYLCSCGTRRLDARLARVRWRSSGEAHAPLSQGHEGDTKTT